MPDPAKIADYIPESDDLFDPLSDITESNK